MLVRMFGVAQNYWMHLFLVHVTGAVWVTLDPHGEMPVLDLAGKEYAVVPRGSILPAVGRPFLVFGHITDAALVTLRERAKALAAVCAGHQPPVFMQLWRTLAQDISSTWFYSDPSFSQFGEPVPLRVITNTGRAVVREHQAFVQAVDPPNQPFWTSAAKLAVPDLDAWKAAKYSWTLSLMPPLPPNQVRLFRDACQLALATTVHDSTMFHGPSVCVSSIASMVESGRERVTWWQRWVSTSGVTATSAVSRQVLIHAWTFWVKLTRDNINFRWGSSRMRSAEHRCAQANAMMAGQGASGSE